jgi:hypothetical protein
MFTFLAPLYLLGALGIAVPIILHLLHHRPQRIHDFPTLRFLLKKKMVADRQRNLKRWIILLLRSLAILALIAAFAYPILKKVVPKQPLGRVVVVDRSGSMWPEQRRMKARELAQRELLSDSNGRVATAFIAFGRDTMTWDFEKLAKDGVYQPLTWADTAIDEGTNPAEALRAAARLLMEHPFEKREIVLISDFAGESWAGEDLRGLLPKGVTLRLQPLGLPPIEGNLAVTDLQIPRSIYGAGEAVRIKARLHNYGASPREVTVAFRWTQLDEPKDFEEPVTKQTVTLAALADTETEFNFLTHNDRHITGFVEIESPTTLAKDVDAFPHDNARRFAILANEPLRVTRLAAKGASAENDLFLKTVFAPFFDKENRRFEWKEQFTDAAELKLTEPRPDLVVLDQGLTLSPAQAEAVTKYVREGGKALFFLGAAERFQDWEKALIGNAVTLGRDRKASGKLTAPTRFSRVRLDHALLAPFSEPGGGNIFATEIRRWREFTLAEGAGEQLISTEAGQPLVTLLPVEKGHAMLWAFPPAREWTDWPLQTTFLPFLYRYAELGGEDPAAGPKGNYLSNDPDIPIIDGSRGVGTGGGGLGKERSVFVVNLDPRESELNPVISPDMLPTLAAAPAEAPASELLPALERPKDPTEDPSTRWVLWLLAGMLLFSLGELFLANRTAT